MKIDVDDAWEGTHTALLTAEPKPETRPIVELKPIDEFNEEPPPEPFSQIQAEINRLRERRSLLKTRMRNLKSYPANDKDFPDGTVMIWHNTTSDWGVDRHWAAVREEGRWYVAGEFHSLYWDELVAAKMHGFDFSEIEVVFPPNNPTTE